MNARLGKWLARIGLGTVALLLLAIIGLGFILGTESGTRWMLGKVSAMTPISIEPRQISGTLLSDLAIGSIRYTDVDRRVTVTDLLLNIDWSGSSIRQSDRVGFAAR